MRSANTETVAFYTREQVAEALNITVNYLRLLTKELREALDPMEFDFRPNDGMISNDAVNKIIQYRELATRKTRKSALEQIKTKGL